MKCSPKFKLSDGTYVRVSGAVKCGPKCSFYIECRKELGNDPNKPPASFKEEDPTPEEIELGLYHIRKYNSKGKRVDEMKIWRIYKD